MTIFDEPPKPRKDIFNPSQSVKKKSQRQEKRLAKQLSGNVVPASGALPGFKGDVSTGSFLIEAKRTDKQSISIQREWLTKISLEASQAGKNPAVAVQIGKPQGCLAGDCEWIMVPVEVFKRLTEKD